VQVESTPAARLRRLELAPSRFRTLALASAAALYAIMITGALVRLTASGLGCESWPGCESRRFLPADDVHAFVEFGNRVFGIVPISLSIVCWLAARRTPALPPWTVRLALAVALGTLAQAPLGLLTITSGLHPLLVMSHFLLALLVLGGAVVVALGAWGHEVGVSAPLVPGELRRLGLVLVAACLGLVVTGTFVTAAGPHPGDSADVRRLGTVPDTIWVHVRVTALFGCALLFLLGYLAARRRQAPQLFKLGLVLLALVLLQMAVGEFQYRTELPWGLVLVHVALAAAVWAVTVAFAAVLWRPPLPLAAPR
jgi:cytochrome c oxidase assembly protein subunit 15